MYLWLFLSPSAFSFFQEILSHFGLCSQGVAQILSEDDGLTRHVSWSADLRPRWFAPRWVLSHVGIQCILFRGRPSWGTSRVVSLVEEMESLVFFVFTEKIVCSLGWVGKAVHCSNKILKWWLYLEGWSENR